jgi:hypothetical protein
LRVIWSRPDAEPIRDLNKMRRFMPFISPRRNDSVFYLRTQLEVEDALRFIDEWNQEAEKPEEKLTLFSLYLRSMTQVVHERPGVNRFVEGGRLWQRRGLWVTFSAKMELLDGAPMVTVKREFPPGESLEQMVSGLLENLRGRRSGKKNQSDREMDFALFTSPAVIRSGLFFLRLANRWGLLPKSMIDPDPMFTSIFVANLGSVGLEAGYHHVWEYGTCSMFATMGKLYERHDGVRCVDVCYTYDERIEDGLHVAISLAQIKEGVENPQKLR